MDHRLLDALAKRGALADPAAMEYFSQSRDPVATLESVLGRLHDVPFLITMEHIQAAATPANPATIQSAAEMARRAGESAKWMPPKLRGLGRATDYAEDYHLLRDITGKSTCEGTLADFSRYFAHRLTTLSGILRTRRELVGAVDIARAKKLTREVRLIGIVSEVRTTKRGDRVIEVEDETDTAPVFVPQTSELFKDYVLGDEVIGVIGRPTEKGLIIADQILRPDVPQPRAFPVTKEPVSVAFVSDIHVGSRTFLREKWDAFSAWIGGGDPLPQSIKYLVMAGDVVDGIGVYPRQEEELLIDDVYAQYEELARLLRALPDRLRVILLPGNHDAVRPAEPQPSLPSNVQKLFDSNVTFVGNPSTFTLHGVRILAYHGRSMDDLVYSLPGMSYARPLDGMREMLRRRHLAPTYGGKTPIAPESEDYLVVDEVPDVFVMGHTHSVGLDEYRGVKTVSASTWQSQTTFQKMHNVVPQAAKVPILNLGSGHGSVKEF
ncbi:MAG TPA: DNA-directed DNA polymerase II small subunit [Thermoplasmata archaeon]|nr:DNA-directed DNA polymerase II small subunit [Thermoplasmata archaeon]